MDDSMPPMDFGDQDMDMGNEPPMDIGGDPNAMGEDPNMDMGGDDPGMNMGDDQNAPADNSNPDMGAEPSGNQEDDELTNIINGLSIEDKAAVTKYAKSMMSDSSDNQIPESRMNFRRIIDETINSIIGNDDSDDNRAERPGKKLSKRQVNNKTNPFVSQY